MSHDSDPLLGRVLAGRYRLLRPLGAGGAGAVYEAEQLGLGRRVAVKLMRPELAADAEHLARFRREAMAAAQLGHPHIVQLFDFAEARGGEPSFLVLELVEGRSLHQLLRAEAPLAPARAVALAVQILGALVAAHRAGIVHRDIKPGNVVIAEVPGVGEVAKVLDFGIARIQESEAYQRLTATGVIVGTPRYMSPEQASGTVVDGRTDLWSVGVILYLALTGRFPFEGSPTDVLVAIMTAPVPPIAMPAVPAALEAAVRRALEKPADARFASAEAMIDALRAALASPIAAAVGPRTEPMDTVTLGAASSRAAPQETRTAQGWTTPQDTSRAAALAQAGTDGSAPGARTEVLGAASRIGQETRGGQTWIAPPTSGLAPSGAAPRATASALSVSAASEASTPWWRAVPAWGRWVAGLATVGGLTVIALLVAALVLWARWGAPAAARSEPGGSPTEPLAGIAEVFGASDAPTHGTSSVFVAHALRRATEIDPGARMASVNGTGFAPRTGEVDLDQGAYVANISFGFVASDGHPFLLTYGAFGPDAPSPALTDPFMTPLSPFTDDVTDSAQVLAVAVGACPRLLDFASVVFSQTGAGSSAFMVSAQSSPMWMGHLIDGRIETTLSQGCR